MKVIRFVPLALLFSYVSYLFYRSPEIADSLVVIALSALYGFWMWIEREREKEPQHNDALEEKQKELALEQIELQVENLKTQKAAQANKRAADGSMQKGDKFVF